jgi:EAL domain-containing protein (putative c-di-GMP-specific phosphodiesterase class I)
MNNQTIYIIDDDQQTADLFAHYAQLMGYQSNVYTEAVKFFEEKEPYAEGSLMILDLNMPEMDGIEVMRQMVKEGNVLPLILVSAYDTGVLHSAEQLAKAHSLDIISTIAKPFTFNVFKDIIQKNTSVERRQVPRLELSFTASELEEAIHKNQLLLYYQPQIDIKSGVLVGLEALVRWQHPIYGLIYPGSFISLAENNGLIGELTTKVIELAFEQAAYWKSQKLYLQISVNISAENITSFSLPDQLSEMFMKYDLDPSMITLEVTESALMGQLVTSLDILTRLRMKDIKLSIDDFGTGYSSLSQLYRIPFTELKVDQSFVSNFIQDDEARGIVKTCIILGHELKMKVVAEGVEDKDTLLLLKEMGCDLAQGYHIAKPMPAEEVISWNTNRSQ